MFRVEHVSRSVSVGVSDLLADTKTDEYEEKAQVVDGKRVLFRDVSFELDSSQILVVQGPSGCGKSQLLRAISGLDPLQRIDADDETPQVSLGGKTLTDIGAQDWRASVRLVSQHRLAPGIAPTPREYFKLCCGFASQQKRLRSKGQSPSSQLDLLRSLVIKLRLSASQLDSDWAHLSGGEAQRALLAVHLALAPDVLLLDEPTAALDPATTQIVERLITDSGVTCVWVTHNAQQAHRVATQVLTLPQGTIETGTSK